MKRNKNLIQRLQSDRGVTFVEVIVSLLILSLLMGLLMSLWTTLLPALSRDRNRLIHLSRDQILRETLDSYFSEIHIAWWEEDYPLEYEDKVWRFPWYKKIEDSILLLQFTENGIELSEERDDSIELLVFLPCETEDPGVLLIYPEEGRLPYVEIQLAPDNTLLIPINSNIVKGQSIEP